MEGVEAYLDAIEYESRSSDAPPPLEIRAETISEPSPSTPIPIDPWSRRAAKRLAMFGFLTDVPCSDLESDDDTRPRSGVCFGISPHDLSARLRQSKVTHQSGSADGGGTDAAGADEFPACFYAQMLNNVADLRSVSAPNTPRPTFTSISVEEEERRFASRMQTSARRQRQSSHRHDVPLSKRSDGVATMDPWQRRIYPSPLVEFCDPKILAQSKETANDLHELIMYVRGLNAASESARAQLRHSRLVRASYLPETNKNEENAR